MRLVQVLLEVVGRQGAGWGQASDKMVKRTLEQLSEVSHPSASAKVCGDFKLLINCSYLPVGLISAATLLSASFTASLPSTPSVRLLCYEYLCYSIITANQQLTISNL